MPKVAFIGTGGTIASVGKGPLDVIDYTANKHMLHADEIISRFPEVREIAEIVPIRFRNIPSYNIYFDEWKELVNLCEEIVATHLDLSGIVIGHGTATLEETAYFLGLTAKVAIPIVLVGSQRPSSGLSTDAGMNLVAAIRTAASPNARGRGVLVVFNDEIHAAREVTKTSTFRLHTFRTPDFGVLGHVDGEDVSFYRRVERRHAPDTEFDIRLLASLPRVDIAYSYAGCDGTALNAFIAAGAKGIVSAGFAPGLTGTAETAALKKAVESGVVVVQSTRAGSGAALDASRTRELGIIGGDNLNPQKCRILLSLALSFTRERGEIARCFREY